MRTSIIQIGAVVLVLCIFTLSGYVAGHNKASLECTIALNDVAEEHIKKTAEEVKFYKDKLAEENAAAALTIAKLKKLKPKTVYVTNDVIKKIEVESGCTDLGAEFGRMFYNIHTHASDR